MQIGHTDLRIENARVVTPEGVISGGVAVAAGSIVAVGADANLPDAETVIDAEGNFLVPGFVDPHVHLGRRDGEYKEQLALEFETETRGAIHGGVTCLLNFVEQGDPYLPDLEFFKSVGEDHSYVDFSHHFVISHDHHVDEIETLAAAGVSSFKMFFNKYKYIDIDIEPAEVDRVFEVMERAADIPNAVTMFHAENAEVCKKCTETVRAEDRHDIEGWSDASPPMAEAMQVEQLGMLSDRTGAHAYAVHISSAEGVEAVRRYRQRGVNLHGETLVTFLSHTTEEDLGVWGKVSPPIRRPRHRKQLWKGLRTGTLQYVGTDHIATSKERIELGEGKHGDHIWESMPGIQPGMEFFLPMMMTEGYNKNRLGIERIVEVCSTNNAKRFGLYPRKGAILEGSDADLVIVDPDVTATIDDDFFHTREPRWSSVHGRRVRGLPTHTIVAGEIAVEHGDLLVEPGGAEFLAR